MLQQLREPLEPEEATELLERLFAHDPKWADGASQTFIEDWVRALSFKPRAFCWMAYEYHIRKPGKWSPGLGDFLSVVEGYESANNLILKELGA